MFTHVVRGAPSPHHNIITDNNISTSHSVIMSANKRAIDVLMNNARNKKCTPSKKRFPCPAGCGCLVTENEVNTHLDKCLGSEPGDIAARTHQDYRNVDDTKCTIGSATKRQNTKEAPTSSTKAKSVPVPTNNGPNAFSHMMKHSANAFSKSNSNVEKVVHHRFHLLNVEGHVTWTSEEENNVNETNDGDKNSAKSNGVSTKEDNATIQDNKSCKIATEEIQWSASTTITSKRMQHIIIHEGDQQHIPEEREDLGLDLTLSSSLPCVSNGEMPRLVQRHSRLSVSESMYIISVDIVSNLGTLASSSTTLS